MRSVPSSVSTQSISTQASLCRWFRGRWMGQRTGRTPIGMDCRVSAVCAGDEPVGGEVEIVLDDDDLIYIRLNPRTHTPFGLGRLEVAFETINAFLGRIDMRRGWLRTRWWSMRCGCRI